MKKFTFLLVLLICAFMATSQKKTANDIAPVKVDSISIIESKGTPGTMYFYIILETTNRSGKDIETIYGDIAITDKNGELLLEAMGFAPPLKKNEIGTKETSARYFENDENHIKLTSLQKDEIFVIWTMLKIVYSDHSRYSWFIGE